MNNIVWFIILLAMSINSCNPIQNTKTTIPKPPTLTITPISTARPTSTPTSTLAPTFTPVPSCHPGNVIEGIDNSNLPPFIDILKVSTDLSNMLGSYKTLKYDNLKVVFTVKSIPDQISINTPDTSQGQTDIVYGVAIDIDNNKSTGWGYPLGGKMSPGYEYILEASHSHQGSEKNVDIQSLLGGAVMNWMMTGNGQFTHSSGNYREAENYLKIDKAKDTITISGNVPGITANSYLSFFAFYYPSGEAGLCDR